MKIVKSFGDSKFFARHWPHKDGTWMWGLGENGELYFKCSELEGPDRFWYAIETPRGNGFMPKIQDMKRIVEEFGYLLVWL